MILYQTLDSDTPDEYVRALLETDIFKALPAAQQGQLYPIGYLAIANYDSMFFDLDLLEKALDRM